jgi:PPOX class probable FMN-dependent enzyme
MAITSESQLRELYGFPKGRAVTKVLSELEQHATHFIETSPFLVISTSNKEGNMDVSPRGGDPGFVRISSPTELVIPDAKGNNRLDSLVNILETGRIGILFLIPGVDETLRINGTAKISIDPKFMSLFEGEKSPPKSCLVISVDEIFLHCAKAFMRSKLWQPETHTDPNEFPSMGVMLKDQIGGPGAPETREEMVKRYQPDI